MDVESSRLTSGAAVGSLINPCPRLAPTPGPLTTGDHPAAGTAAGTLLDEVAAALEPRAASAEPLAQSPAGGELYAWGYNVEGQLGDGTPATPPAPAACCRSQ